MKFKPLKPDDVINISTKFLIQHPTFLVGELLDVIRERLGIRNSDDERYPWFEEGIQCEILEAEGNSRGWQSGKVRIYIEFCPDDDLLMLEKPDQASKLDELRNLDN